jgi:hypothetical protein
MSLQPLEDRHLIHHVRGDELPEDSTARLSLPPPNIDHPMKTEMEVTEIILAKIYRFVSCRGTVAGF